MIARWIPRLAFAISLAACSTRADTRTLQSALDQQLAQNARRYGIAGQAVLILHNGKTVYRGSQGLASRETREPVRPDHLFSVFSVSKLFASVLALQLMEQGRLDLKATIASYLPNLPERWRTVRVEEILNHVSGLPDYWDINRTPLAFPPTREALIASLADKPLVSLAGTKTQYNQTNFILLAAILEALYHRPYRKIVSDEIIEPLGLRNTYLGKSHAPAGRVVADYTGKNHQLVAGPSIDWPEYAIVHTELFATVDDLGNFLNALAEGRLLKRETLLKQWKPYRYKQGGSGGFASGWDYGTSGRYKHVGHEGGNKVRVRMLFDEALRDTYVFIYLTNGSAENVWSSTLIESLMDIAAPHELRE
jgi:D-alanyl-D-alanine carboxypeptidase